MYNKLKRILGTLVLSNAIEARGTYTGHNLSLARIWTWDNQTRTAWCNSTGTYPLDVHSVLSLGYNIQIGLAVIVAPVLKERLINPILNKIYNKCVKCTRPFQNSTKSSRVTSNDASINALFVDENNSYAHLHKYLQRVDYFLSEQAGWQKSYVVQQSHQDDLLGYRYTGGLRDTFEFSIVEGGFSHEKRSNKNLIDPTLKSSAIYINRHPYFHHVMESSDVVDRDRWETKDGLQKFLKDFLQTLNPQALAYFKKILKKDSSFIFESSYLSSRS